MTRETIKYISTFIILMYTWFFIMALEPMIETKSWNYLIIGSFILLILGIVNFKINKK